MMEDIETRVLELAADIFRVPEDSVERSSSLISDLGADTLDNVAFITKLEEEFGVTITENDSDGIETVGDAISLVERLLKEQR